MTKILADVIVSYALFLEFTDEEQLDLDLAVRQQEDLAYRLRKLNADERHTFAKALEEIAATTRNTSQRDFIIGMIREFCSAA